MGENKKKPSRSKGNGWGETGNKTGKMAERKI